MARGAKAQQAANRRAAVAADAVSIARAEAAEARAELRRQEIAHRDELVAMRREFSEQVDDLVEQRYGDTVERAIAQKSASEIERREHQVRVECARVMGLWMAAGNVVFKPEALADLATELRLGRDAGALFSASAHRNRLTRRATSVALREQLKGGMARMDVAN